MRQQQQLQKKNENDKMTACAGHLDFRKNDE